MEDIVKQILKQNNISYNKITKATSGFTNIVYFVDDKVVKFTNDIKNKEKLNKEINIYKNLKLDNMPKYITSGVYKDYCYLIISKVYGQSLYSIWYQLDNKTKENVVKSIADILRAFHNQDFQFLPDEFKMVNWVNYIKNELLLKCLTLKRLGFEVLNLEFFINSKLEQIFKNNKFGLVYNDAHFDNFIYDGNKLYIIDFDRVVYCPIDYEMLIFKTMCDNPLKFANEEDEKIVFEEDFKDVYKQFKSFYKDLFNNDSDIRIFIYQFNYLLGQAIKCNDHSWINKLLTEFNEFIKK